jgi:hypothetical protein
MSKGLRARGEELTAKSQVHFALTTMLFAASPWLVSEV